MKDFLLYLVRLEGIMFLVFGGFMTFGFGPYVSFGILGATGFIVVVVSKMLKSLIDYAIDETEEG